MNIKNKIFTILTSALLLFGNCVCSAWAEDALFYKTVDISGYYNAKAYLNLSDYNSVTIDSDDDFWSWGGDNYRHNYALNGDSVETLKAEDGFVYDNSGIPFLWNTSGAIQVRKSGSFSPGAAYTNGATVDIENGNYSKISFLAYSVVGSKTYKAFTVDMIYTDGTEKKSVYINSREETTATALKISAYAHWVQKANKGSTITTFGNAGNTAVDTYTVQADETRTLDKIRFYNSGVDYAGSYEQSKVLALTLAQKSVDTLIMENLPTADEITIDNLTETYEKISNIENTMAAQGKTENDLFEEAREKLNSVREKCNTVKFEYIESLVEALPEVDAVTPNVYYDVKESLENLTAEMTKYGVSETELSENAQNKLSELKDKLAESKPSYTTFDISSYRNSKLFAYEAQKENIRINEPHDFFNYGQPGTYYNNFALDGDTFRSYLNADGIIEDKSHIPYYIDSDLAVAVSGSSYGIRGVNNVEIDLTDGAYSSINFIAFSFSGTANYNSTTITLIYDDKSSTVFKKFPIKGRNQIDEEDKDWIFGLPSYAHWNVGQLDKVSFGAKSEYNGIYTYEVIPEEGKIVDKIVFKNENTYLGWYERFKVLAISAVDERPEKIKAYTETKLSELSKAASISAEDLKAIKANLDKLEQLGIDTQDLKGISEFNSLYDNLLEVKSNTVTSKSDFINAQILLSSKAKDFTKDKIKLVSDSKEINPQYIDFALTEENGMSKINLTFPNFLDYSSKYRIVLSKDIESEYDSRMSLYKDRTLEFKITPSVYFSNITAVQNGNNMTVSVDMSNENSEEAAPYSVMFGFYSADGMLLKYAGEDGAIPYGQNKSFSETLTIPENTSTVEFYAVDSNENKRLIWEPVVVQGG